MREEQVIRLFGVPEDTVRERLSDVVSDDALAAVFSYADGDGILRLPADLASVGEAVRQRLGAYIYSETGETPEQRAVALLKEKKLTVATAESCTGGLLSSRLTAVSGCSQVFGTGVVSYSWDCKEQLLGVSPQTLETYGAVSAQTAREMACGIRRRSGASLGIGITGEAGPTAAEDKPVGTVFVALADKRRSWVKEWHFDGDREAVRRTAANYALDMLRRYLEAFPAVMAGGERHGGYTEQPQQVMSLHHWWQRFVAAVLPWRGSMKKRLFKTFAWVSVLAVLLVGVLTVYNRVLAPDNNRELQGELADMYWNREDDLTVQSPAAEHYPAGMRPQFRNLYDMNKDIAGWVRVPDTAINYPVTLYAGGYYVNHNFNDQYSVYGQPYFDKQITQDTLSSTRVLAIHGSNTRDDQMFSALLSYRRIAYLREHAVVEMTTLFADAYWEIFAVCVVDERDRDRGFDYLPASFGGDSAYEAYLRQLQRRSLFTTDAQLRADDRVLLLVTDVSREYGFSGAQLVVAARQVKSAEAPLTYVHNASVLWPQAYAQNTTTHTTTTREDTTVTTSSTVSTTVTTTLGDKTTLTTSSTATTTTDSSTAQDSTLTESTTASTTTTSRDTTTDGSLDMPADSSTTLSGAEEDTTTENTHTTTSTQSVRTTTSSQPGEETEEKENDDYFGY